MAIELAKQRCKPCEGGIPPLTPAELADMGNRVHGDWRVSSDHKTITRKLIFQNYYQTTAFINAVVFIAHSEDHHPDIRFGYKEVEISWSTHSVDGLTDNDFICAAKVDALLPADA